jgi:hypothetical protein
MPGAVFGLAATSLHGCTGSALEPVEGQPIAQMMRMPIHDGCVATLSEPREAGTFGFALDAFPARSH